MTNNMSWTNIFDQQLNLFCQRENNILQQATLYCLKTGGKRLRPHLIYATGLDLGVPIEALHYPAIAIELIHTYTLIHDDLPAMDNDDYRRGQPSCHKAFSEATAILTGDKLQAEAFAILSEGNQAFLNEKQQINMIQLLSQACMAVVNGQAMDLGLGPEAVDANNIVTVHLKKTAALFSAALGMAGSAAQVNPHVQQQLQNAGNHIGVAFQIQDDLDDTKYDSCNYLNWYTKDKAKHQIQALKQQALHIIKKNLTCHAHLLKLIDKILPNTHT